MLTTKQVNEIREHLEKAQSPIFFFDNDQDGLCSFLLLRRFIDRGKGVSIKSFPELNKEYFRKVHELKADYIFILDKPEVSQDFFLEADKFNIPVVWIDHHVTDKEKIPKFIYYYNPLFNKTKTGEPVTALCYQISGKKEDMWIAMTGCISDRFIPKFYPEFQKRFPELAINTTKVETIIYKSPIGKIAKLMGFGLKDTTTNVVSMLKFLTNVKNPMGVLEENKHNKVMHYRYNQIESKYQKLLKKSISLGNTKSKVLFFQYSGDLSITGELSNELNFTFPGKIIVVAYIKGMKVNISMRGNRVLSILKKAISGLENARGGGHKNAVGGQLRVEDLETFRENVENIVSGNKA